MDESKVTMKGRLGPGMMITVDLLSGQVCTKLDFGLLGAFATLLVLWGRLSFKFIIEGSWSITEQSRLWNIYFVNLLAEVIRSLLIKYS